MELYKYWINLYRDYRQFEVQVPYRDPNQGIQILTAQYGGENNVKVQFWGKA